ncbi:MAG: hypothetical protein ABI600_16745 [Luteolibacter sp.]
MTQVAIRIPDDLKPFLDESVRMGAFRDAEGFLVNLLYNVKAQSESEWSEEQQTKFVVLRKEIAAGIEQAERGDFVEFTAVQIIDAGRTRRASAHE